MKVSADQSEFNGDKLKHVPTGAEFWAGEKEPTDRKPISSGHNYDSEEIKQMAWEIFHKKGRIVSRECGVRSGATSCRISIS